VGLTEDDKKTIEKVVMNFISELDARRVNYFECVEELKRRIDFTLYSLGIFTLFDESEEKIEAYVHAEELFEKNYKLRQNLNYL